MIRSIGNLYAYLLGWPWLARLNLRLFYLCGRALGLHNYTSDRVSGEGLTLRHCLKGRASPVVFDVGANEGEWVAAVVKGAPGAQIHAFEPQEALATKIAARHPSVRVNNVAVGDQAGELALYDYADHSGSQHASVISGVIETVHGATSRSTNVQVVTIDDYCRQHAVTSIDLLKIDVEGYEMNVLRGADHMVREGRVEAIQFEFNEMNVLGRTFLHDFMSRLSSMYAIHRVLPHGLMPLQPGRHWINEQFTYQNILAIRK